MFVVQSDKYFYLVHSYWNKEEKRHKKKKYYLGKYPVLSLRLYRRIKKELGEHIEPPPETMVWVSNTSFDKKMTWSNKVPNLISRLGLLLAKDELHDSEKEVVFRNLFWLQGQIDEFAGKKSMFKRLKAIG